MFGLGARVYSEQGTENGERIRMFECLNVGMFEWLSVGILYNW